MRFRPLLFCVVAIGLITESSRGQAVIEGRVELLKTSAAPVVIKRYEIVTVNGIVATKPPLAVVYLEGSFPKRPVKAEQQMLQKDLNFVPAPEPLLAPVAEGAWTLQWSSDHPDYGGPGIVNPLTEAGWRILASTATLFRATKA